MDHRTEIELDTWTSIGDLFAQIVAAAAPKVLGKVACRMA